MCNRTPIPNNTSVWIAGAEYQIIEQIGAGGQSLIYRAKQLENDLHKEVVIKEFFPNYGAIRKNRVVVAEKQCDQALFQEQKRTNFIRDQLACEVAKKSHQAQYTAYVHDLERGLSVHPMLPQDCVSIERVLHSMGNRDNVLDGRFYTDLSRVKRSIKIIKSLLGAVSRIHESGLLHLDLSISNVFLGETTADGTAYIIDYGSCVENGHCSAAPFWSSAGYAAPELNQSLIRLTPKADLYSVGVILMLLCCGEKCLDEGNPIELPGQNYRNVRRYTSKLNIPVQTIQKLENIIIKSTRRDGDSNYEAAEDMLQDIVSLEKTMDSAYISLANNIPSQLPSALWLPRPDEFKDLSTLLDEGTKEIFVFGDGGLGKTEFIVSFANKYRGHYDFYFTTYKGSVRDTVLQLQFDGWDPKMFDANTHRMVTKPTQQQFEEKLQLLRAFQSESKAVLIIDNFDANSDDADPLADSDLPHLLGLNVQLIMTTRMNLPQKNHVEIKRFSTDELMVLMHRHLGNLFEAETDVLKTIIDKVDRNTLLVDLVARLLQDSLLGVSPKDVLNALQDRKWGSLAETVSGEYNRDASARTVLNHLFALFDLSNLSADACYVLSSAALLPEDGFNCPLFLQCLGSDEKWIDIVSRLRRTGWINHNRQITNITIHPLVKDACLQYDGARPTSQRCQPFIQQAIEISENPNLSHTLLVQLMQLFLNTYRIAALDLFRLQSLSVWKNHTLGITFNAAFQNARRCGAFDVAINMLNAQIHWISKCEEGTEYIPYLCLYMAEIFYEGNGHQEALNYSESVLSKCNSLHSRFYSIICRSHSVLGNHEESIRAGLAALEYADQDPVSKENATMNAYENLAFAYSGAKDYSQSLHYTTKYWDYLHTQNPSDEQQIHACLKMSSAYYGAKDYEKSIQYAEMVVKQFPKQYSASKPIQAEVEIRLAFAYSLICKYEESLKHAELAIEINSTLKHPDDPDLSTCHAIVGACYLELGNKEKADYHLSIAKNILQNTFSETHPLLQDMLDSIDGLNHEQP